MVPATKVCTRCGLEKRTTEDFYRQKMGRYGRRAICKPCSSADSLRWARANAVRHAATVGRWQKANPEKVNAAERARYAKEPEKYRARKNGWADRNREKQREMVLAWMKAHPERCRAHGQRRRSLQVAAAGADYTSPEHVEARWEMFGGWCYYCGAEATATDHRIPLSRGGSHWPANLVPVCKLCNSRKGTKTEQEFLVLQ